MSLTARNRNIIIGSVLGASVVVILVAILLLRGCGEETVVSTGDTSTKSATSTARTTPTATAPIATTSVESPPVSPPATTTPVATPDSQSNYSTACTDSIGIVPSPATADASITVTVKVRGTTASVVKVKYGLRGSGDPGVERALAPAGYDGTLAVWEVTFNAPHVPGEYDFYSWSIDELGRTFCGGPVGTTISVQP